VVISQAEDLIRKLRAAHKLETAIVARKIPELELSLAAVKAGGWEKHISLIVTRAEILLEKVHTQWSPDLLLYCRPCYSLISLAHYAVLCTVY